MGQCSNCGKDIDADKEICDECASKQRDADESYLDGLLQSITGGEQEQEETQEQEQEQEEDLPISLDELEAQELAQLAQEEPTLLSDTDFTEDNDTALKEKMDNNEDISELLDLLSEHYDGEEEAMESMETSMGMDDVFSDALSAVAYENEEDDVPFAIDDSSAMEETMDLNGESEKASASENFDDIVPVDMQVEELLSKEIESATANEGKKEKKKRKSFRERFFSNIIDETIVQKELEEKEKEILLEEKKKVDAEQAKIQAEEDKLAKETAQQEEKERKEVLKAAKIAEKQEKAEKKAAEKKARLEAEANQVVGKINPVGASIVFVFFIGIGLSAYFGSQLFSYKNFTKEAEAYMNVGNYQKAYRAIDGINLSAADQVLYDKSRIGATLEQHLNASDNFIELKMPLEALDALVKGIKSYDKDKSSAEKLGLIGVANKLEEELATRLREDFHMTVAEARLIIKSKTREEYTLLLKKKLSKLDQWKGGIK